MSTISNILKSFLTQNILGYIGVTLILIVICLGFIYNMRVKKKYENLLNAFNESEWINVSNNEDQKELKFLNSELKAMADDFRKSAIKGTYNINTEVIIQKNIEKENIKRRKYCKYTTIYFNSTRSYRYIFRAYCGYYDNNRYIILWNTEHG